MPPLKNDKHERFAQAVVELPSHTEAYSKVYPNSSADASRFHASRLVSNGNVRNRVSELLERNNLGVNTALEHHNFWIQEHKQPAQSWDAVKTLYKLHGLLDDDRTSEGNRPLIVNIITADTIKT